MRKSLLTLLFCIIASALVQAKNSEFRKSIKEHAEEIKACKSQEVRANPGVSVDGKLVIDWLINDQGEVVEANRNNGKSTLRNEGIATCVLEKLRGWKFPPAPKGRVTTISYPFIFPGE